MKNILLAALFTLFSFSAMAEVMTWRTGDVAIFRAVCLEEEAMLDIAGRKTQAEAMSTAREYINKGVCIWLPAPASGTLGSMSVSGMVNDDGAGPSSVWEVFLGEQRGYIWLDNDDGPHKGTSL